MNLLLFSIVYRKAHQLVLIALSTVYGAHFLSPFKKVQFSIPVLLVSLFSCIYTPQQQPSPGFSENDNQQTGKTLSGTIFPVNLYQQTCNPSMSQNQHYTGCMLWLGFDKLSVNVPQDLVESYSLQSVQTHDRLTITDTSNTVRWYIFRNEIASRGEIQCPEWSTHPEYISCLTGTKTKPYSNYVIRLSDKKSLKLIDNTLEEFSTPHLWVSQESIVSPAIPDSIRYDQNGVSDIQSVQTYFGTDKVVCTYALPLKSGSVYFIDFSKASVPVALAKPEGKETWTCHSPLISPDGNWVTYHCYLIAAQGMQYASYIQQLSPTSKPVLIAESASDPHWWIDIYNNNEYYIIYTYTPDAYFVETDFLKENAEQSGSGATLKQKLKGTWHNDVPSHVTTLTPDYSIPPDTLVKLPFKGGLSPDGRYLGTAYKYAYILGLK